MLEYSAYIALRFAVWVINLLPQSIALGLGSFIGAAAFSLGGTKKNMVVQNILKAFAGEKTEREALEIVKGLYKNLALNFIEFARLRRRGKSYFDENVSFSGLENIDRALAAGKGVIILTAHYGNWELMSAFSARGYKLSAVVRPLDNKYINAYLEESRRAFGSVVIGKKNAARKMLGDLKNNRILTVLLDQRSSRREGVIVDFFNMPARTNKGLAAMAMKTGAVVIPVFICRESSLKHKIICRAPITLADSGDKEADVLENTRRFTAAIEEFIRLRPDHWFWFHSRWERRKEVRRTELRRKARRKE